MGKETIVERILSDAEAEAAEIVRAAQTQAEGILSAANARAAQDRAEAEAEIAERAKRISDGKAAAARLDSAKILLAEKRRVLDEIYARALERLLHLSERDCLALLQRLIEAHAEAGDEVVLSKYFAYEERARKLPVVAERGLVFAQERADISGGCILRGKSCDKDLSYAALLQADLEEHQAEIAEKLFGLK